MKRAIPSIVGVAICFALGLIASFLQADAIANWYPFLNKPSITPPDWAFPVAWGIIYLLSGISVGIVWNRAGKYRNEITALWGVQQGVNFLWSILFFTMTNPLLGLIAIIILDILVLWYIVETWSIVRTSSFLFIPYALWLCLATYLNVFVYLYN
jgi:integral membrane protein